MKNKLNKKPFKDTKLGKLIKKAAPEVLDTATDVAAAAFPPLAIVDKLVDDVVLKKPELSSEIMLARTEYEVDYKAYLVDVQDARDMYLEKSDTADVIAKKIMTGNMVLVVILVLIEIAIVAFIDSKTAAILTGAVGTVMGALINERNTVVNFFYGSSHGSKLKDKR